ncbi:MAG TPA: AAA family ATPase [Acidimicrobiales bacterium]|nr:AAA family ATPase [Acidimicrobiales bacterium]
MRRSVQVEITLTGDVRVGDVAVSGPSRVVLAALVLERPAGIPRDRLADILWPDGPPRTWASALRTHVSRVRSVLAAAVPTGGEIVVAGETGYHLALPAGVTLDVDVERAEAALHAARVALGAGDAGAALAAASGAVDGLRAPFLPGHPGEWAEDVRAGLDETRVAAHEAASQAALAAGEPGRALAAAEAAVARAPLRESAHRARLAALAAGGNRAEALRAYQRLRRALANELGVDPSPETEAAYLDLLGPPARSGPAAAAGAPGAAAVAPFVGRARELAALAQAWDQAAAGARHVVVVTGEAGIGKTRLTTEAARRVGHDGVVLFGRCDQEAIVPYQPVVEALDGLVAATPPDELPALGDEAFAELAAVLPSLAGPRRAAGGDGRARLFAAVTDLVAATAKERPLLLVLDDLQWADDDTLLLMRHLLRRAGNAAVLVVAITRDHDLEPGHMLGEVVRSLERDGWVRRLPLTGLAEAEVAELAGRLGSGADAGRLVAETAGNPFLLTELLRAGTAGEAIPAGVQALVTTRMARLGAQAADLVRAAAVAGARFELDLAAAAAGLEGGRMLDALDAALASGLVVEEDADRYRFPHDIVRRTLVAQLSGARRRALHHALAAAIESLRAGDLDAHAAVLAHHAAAGAGPRGDARAVHWARVASVQAAAHSAPAEAVRLCRQALVLVPTGDAGLLATVTAELGAALVAAGDPGGPATLVAAADLAARSGQPDVLTTAALALADAAQADPALRVEAARVVEAAAAAGPGPDPAEHARLLARRLRLGGEARPQAATVRALHDRIESLAGPAAAEECRALAGELEVLAAASGQPALRVLAAHDRAMAAATLGDEEGAAGALHDLALAAPPGDPFAAAALADRAAARLVATGPFDEAVAALARVAETHEALAPGTGDAAAARHRAVLAYLWSGLPLPGPAPAGGDGLHDLALAALGACAGGGAGDPTGAARVREALAPYAESACGDGYRTFAGAAAFHLGRLAAVAGERAEAERHLLTALRLHTAWRARPWVAWTQAALATVLDRRGRPTDREWIAGLRAESDWIATSLGLRSL